MIFNKKVSHNYFETVYKDILEILELYKSWYPQYNNALELYQKNGKKWECVPAGNIEATKNEEAYQDMPKELISYLKELPEYDEEIFNEITGRKAG